MPLPWHQILPFFVYSTKVLHQFQIELLNICSTKLSTKYFGFSTKLFEDPPFDGFMIGLRFPRHLPPQKSEDGFAAYDASGSASSGYPDSISAVMRMPLSAEMFKMPHFPPYFTNALP